MSTVRAWDYSRTKFTQASPTSTEPTGATVVDNRYPTEDVLRPLYTHVLDELYSKQNLLAEMLLVGIAEMLSLPSTTLSDMCHGPDGRGDFGTIRLLHYPGSPDLTTAERAVANVGIAPHTDFEAFTLMHQVSLYTAQTRPLCVRCDVRVSPGCIVQTSTPNAQVTTDPLQINCFEVCIWEFFDCFMSG